MTTGGWIAIAAGAGIVGYFLLQRSSVGVVAPGVIPGGPSLTDKIAGTAGSAAGTVVDAIYGKQAGTAASVIGTRGIVDASRTLGEQWTGTKQILSGDITGGVKSIVNGSLIDPTKSGISLIRSLF